ncbi:hypothetical protein EDB86DRAFT_1601060 [Lactarius hatsudake]|nr:hypothetical protein EDB86DRAFT_1601060 [Lactarius hatsudake]
MQSLSSFALASVFSIQILAASVGPRGLEPPGWESLFCLEDNRDFGLPLLTGAGFADPAGMTIENARAIISSSIFSRASLRMIATRLAPETHRR